ncbi:MAG: DedA family protein [Acidobacteria bacterium]|jgi:membrane-associated protein|nr:DedA family protein [Acidobacteriota bacterium]
MNWFFKIIDFILHLDKYINILIQDFGVWTYFILFLIIFCETGLVITPFLPGDSLLFAAGAFSARGSLDLFWLFIILTVSAIIGDTVNYWIGHFVGPKIFQKENVRFFKKEYLERTHQFYEKYGGETIILARFIPIIRTFAPFVAGIGKMTYLKFISYNIIGGIGWVAIFLFGGYFFGNIPFVKKHFTIIIFAIIIISVLPGVIEFIRMKRHNKTALEQKSV